jgi:hypothetical protein
MNKYQQCTQQDITEICVYFLSQRFYTFRRNFSILSYISVFYENYQKIIKTNDFKIFNKYEL